MRYFTTIWTDHVSDGGVVTTAPLSPPPLGPSAGVIAHHAALPASRRAPRGTVLVLIGGILMFLGPLFSWETVSVSDVIYAGGSVKGTSEGAGPVVLVAGIIVAVLAVLLMTGTTGTRKVGISTLLIALVSVVFCIGNWSAISNDIDKAPSGVDANIGIGLILAVVGCALTAIASISLIRRPR